MDKNLTINELSKSIEDYEHDIELLYQALYMVQMEVNHTKDLNQSRAILGNLSLKRLHTRTFQKQSKPE